MNNNKRQFFTQSTPEPAIQNTRKHKFSNVAYYPSAASPIPVTNSNVNSQMGTSIGGTSGNRIPVGETYNQKQIQDEVPLQRQQNKSSSKPVTFGKPNDPEQTLQPQSMSQKRPIQSLKIQEKCIICGTITQKCCSLCRKVFYCSSEHQEVDWHMRHKFECEGKVQEKKPVEGEVNPVFASNNTNKFVFYSNNSNQTQPRNESYEKEMDYQAIQRFLELLEQRLVMRSKIMNQVVKLNERTPLIVRQSLVRQTEELLELSSRITNQEFKPSYSRKITKKDVLDYSSQQWGSGIVLTQVGVGLQYYADLLLMIKMYHLCGMTKEARESIISIGKLLEDPEQKGLFLQVLQDKHGGVEKKLSFTSVNSSPVPNTNANALFNSTNSTPMNFPADQVPSKNEDSTSKTRNLILEQISHLSEFYNIDKTTQSVYKLYIKKIQIEEGIWEQIYAYFNVGVWYMEKTYYDKSIKSFLYALELLDSHKKGVAESVVFKADCLFNIGLDYWALGESVLAIENMQSCYRLRMNSIGKNSMESSYCLFHLAKWYKSLEKWNECLQYLDECHRIRKLYEKQPNYEGKVQQIKGLIGEVYEIIKKEKRRHAEVLDPRSQKYFSQILQKEEEEERRSEEKRNEEMELLPKGTVASRLFREDKEYVKFNVIISEDFFKTLNSSQVNLLEGLLNRIDQRLQRSEAIRVLVENDLVGSLTNEQRELFFKENQIKKGSP